jgi:hypothetical protein
VTATFIHYCAGAAFKLKLCEELPFNGGERRRRTALSRVVDRSPGLPEEREKEEDCLARSELLRSEEILF